MACARTPATSSALTPFSSVVIEMVGLGSKPPSVVKTALEELTGYGIPETACFWQYGSAKICRVTQDTWRCRYIVDHCKWTPKTTGFTVDAPMSYIFEQMERHIAENVSRVRAANVTCNVYLAKNKAEAHVLDYKEDANYVEYME